MSFDDFCKCNFDEFESIYKAWHDMQNGTNRDSWERTRTFAAICIQPHVRKKITPRQLLPLPWDKKTESHTEELHMTAEERRLRFESVARRLGDETVL